MKQKFMKKYIGDRAFYKMVLAVTIPIMVQNAITNFVSLLDNIMVGRVGTIPMSGVSIVNQLLFVFYLLIFGGLSGAGIFGSQFWGKRDNEGLRYVLRMKLFIAVTISIFAIAVFLLFGEQLIALYLDEGNDPIVNEETLYYAIRYLRIMVIGLPAFAIANMYSSSLRETEETIVPMVAGVCAVFVNLFFNYVLIFGHFGFEAMGVEGAAIATVISRYVEVAIIIIYTYTHTKRFEYFKGALRSLVIPVDLLKQMIYRGFPLLLNEGLWSAGMAVLLQCYSCRGIDVVAAMNISNTIINLFNVTFFAMGNAVAIIIGKYLGANEIERAKDEDRKLIFMAVMIAVFVAILAIATSPFFPQIYNTEENVKTLASSFIIIAACYMPMNSYLHSSYFTIRSGGKTLITFLFDSVFMWVVSAPVALVLSRFTDLPIRPLYAIVLGVEVIKCVVGTILLKKGIWINNIVDTKE